MEIAKIKNLANDIIAERKEILFGYRQGAAFDSEKPHDIDIDIFITPEFYKDLHIKGELHMGYMLFH